MPAFDEYRYRQIVHQLSSIAAVGLQQQALLMTAAAYASAVIEQPFAAIVRGVMGLITGERQAERRIVGGHVTFWGAGDGIDHALVLGQQRLLDAWQHTVGVLIKTRVETRWAHAGDRLIAAIEQIIQADETLLDILLETLANRLCPRIAKSKMRW